MDTRYRDFDAFAAEHQDAPVVFRLGGKDWHASGVNAFHLLAFTRKLMTNQITEVVTGYDDFVTEVLPQAERALFQLMLREANVSLATLTELGNWVVEQAAGNPMDAPSASPASPLKRGGRRKVVSLSPASTSAHSPRAKR